MDAILGKIGFDWHLAIVNFVNVFIIFLVLKKWAFGPIGEIIEKRKTAVEASIAAVSEAEVAKKQAEAEKEALLTQARLGAQEILEGAQKEAKGLEQVSRTKAQKEHQEILHKAQLEIDSEKKAALSQVRQEAASLVAQGIRKILGNEVDQKMNERITQKAK